MLKIEYKSVEELIPYARNARTHSDTQVAQIAASIKEFGWTTPILIDGEDSIIAGHGRVLAARKLKLKKVPTIQIAHLTPEQKRAYILADNKLTLNGDWDIELLRVELDELNALEFNLDLTGFSLDELSKLLSPEIVEGETDPDAVPDAPIDPITKPGDVWILGNHRLVCGDCTDPLQVAKALNGIQPHLMVTDPPYGVEYDPSRRDKGLKDGAKRALNKINNDDRADWTDAWALFPGTIAYVWHGMKTAAVVEKSLADCGFELRSQIVWAKKRFTLSPKNINPLTAGYNPQHECCFYLIKNGSKSSWKGDKSQSTLWDIEHLKSDTGHGSQKPVECMSRPIEHNSSPGQCVYDPFLGSGTTLIACEMLGRNCHALEIDPKFVDVAVKRWEEFTGREAHREESDGTP